MLPVNCIVLLLAGVAQWSAVAAERSVAQEQLAAQSAQPLSPFIQMVW